MMNWHNETIECPVCETIQTAEVEHTVPFYSYVHECISCGHTIMESEWNTVYEIRGQRLTEQDKGRRVTYVPGHADGDAGHPDCETGTLMHWNNAGAMVDYGRNKCRTDFTDLIWG